VILLTQKNKIINTANLPYLVIIAGLLLIIIYLLSGSWISDSRLNGNTNPAAPLPNGPDIVQEPAVYTGMVPEPVIDFEFAGFFPENISGMRRVVLLMDSMDYETDGQFNSKIKDMINLLYLSDSSVQIDHEVEYSVYKMESPEAAAEVLEYYTTEKKWNTVKKKFTELDNFTFWIWDGYLEGSGRLNGMYVYWDSISNGAFLSNEKLDDDYIARAKTDMFCRHGEAVYNEYFIMVDVHAPLDNIVELSDRMFEEAVKQITSEHI
jgi:hypothetical protein